MSDKLIAHKVEVPKCGAVYRLLDPKENEKTDRCRFAAEWELSNSSMALIRPILAATEKSGIGYLIGMESNGVCGGHLFTLKGLVS